MLLLGPLSRLDALPVGPEASRLAPLHLLGPQARLELALGLELAASGLDVVVDLTPALLVEHVLLGRHHVEEPHVEVAHPALARAEGELPLLVGPALEQPTMERTLVELDPVGALLPPAVLDLRHQHPTADPLLVVLVPPRGVGEAEVDGGLPAGVRWRIPPGRRVAPNDDRLGELAGGGALAISHQVTSASRAWHRARGPSPSRRFGNAFSRSVRYRDCLPKKGGRGCSESPFEPPAGDFRVESPPPSASGSHTTDADRLAHPNRRDRHCGKGGRSEDPSESGRRSSRT